MKQSIRYDRSVSELASAHPRRSPRMARRQAENRERILDATERAFVEGDQRNIRMEQIAEDADMSVGALYKYFGSKDGILLALAERALQRFSTYLDEAFRPEYSPLEQVLAAGEVYLQFHLDHRESFRFLAFDGYGPNLSQGHTDLQQQVGQRLEEILDRFQAHLESAIDAGEVSPHYPPKETARFLWGAWNGVISLTLRSDRMALTDGEIAASLDAGRRLVNEGLAHPAFRNEDGNSRARVMNPTENW